MSEMPGIEAPLVLEDEINDLKEMSDLLDSLKKNRRATSPKIKDKGKNRAKAKQARASRRSNRG